MWGALAAGVMSGLAVAVGCCEKRRKKEAAKEVKGKAIKGKTAKAKTASTTEAKSGRSNTDEVVDYENIAIGDRLPDQLKQDLSIHSVKTNPPDPTD